MNENFIDVTINKEVSNQDKYMKLASSSIVEYITDFYMDELAHEYGGPSKCFG